MIKVLIVEDNKVVRDGIALLLTMQDDIEVFGETDSAAKALDLLNNGPVPDIILTDLNMPEMNGIEFTREICRTQPATLKVIILTMHAKQSFVDEAFKSGVKGYLLKDGDFDELFRAIHAVHNNRTFISAGIIP